MQNAAARRSSVYVGWDGMLQLMHGLLVSQIKGLKEQLGGKIKKK